MTYFETVVVAAKQMGPLLLIGPLMLIPFVVLEQIWPVERRPRFTDYGTNILIGMSTALLALPAGIAGGMWSASLRMLLPWKPVAFSFDTIREVPYLGGPLEIAAMILVPLLLHDLWFYWAHRIEHKVPFLWEFHKIHHSDELMNAATSGRDHFLQAVWIGIFPAFTLGLIFDLDAIQAGKAALLSGLALSLLSNFYHSAIRVRVPWLDRLFVTPQVHRIHHSVDPAHHNRNFADALPIFDILFGTWHRPGRDEFPSTGLGSDYPAPRTFVHAQIRPIGRVLKMIF